jgi:hypothetical protein
VEGKIILKLALDLKSHGHHSQAGITMNKFKPKPTLERLIVAFLRVPGGLSAIRTLSRFLIAGDALEAENPVMSG